MNLSELNHSELNDFEPTVGLTAHTDIEAHIARAQAMRSEYIAHMCSSAVHKLAHALHIGHKSDHVAHGH